MCAVACIAAVIGAYFYRSHADTTPSSLLSYLPRNSGVVAYLDVDALRRSGFLDMIAGSKSVEDSDYVQFVADTRFDYRKDLDSAAISIQGSDKFFALHGRFDWGALADYVRQHGGRCTGRFCRIEGSRPERQISFYRLRSNVMALAVSTDRNAADRIGNHNQKFEDQIPPQPMWIALPGAVLRDSQSLPEGTRTFAAALQNADTLLFTLGGQKGQLILDADVTCHDSAAAIGLYAQLQAATGALNDWLVHEHRTADPKDVTGVLTAGTFRREDRRVFGEWPVPRAFLEAVAGGSY